MSKQHYLLLRSKIEEVFDLIEKGNNIIAVCSDLGNGKSLFLDGLRIVALDKGYRVFDTQEHNDEAVPDLELIAKLNGKVLLNIEDYQDWITEIGQFKRIARDGIKLILTARNAIHDVNFEALQREVGSKNIPELFLDNLDDPETNWFIDSLNEYGLWGESASLSREEKTQLIKVKCKGQVHALLLKIIDSPDIGGRLRKLADSLKTNRDKYKILIGTCILTLLNQKPSLDTLVDIFGTEALSSSQFRRDPVVSQFLDYSTSEILLKSPIATQYILKRIADPAFTISVLIEMAERVDIASSTSKRYRKMMTNLMMFSNVQSILPENSRFSHAISYYESIKNLTRCQTSPLFWLQYAIPCLLSEYLPRCKLYLDTAYAYASQQDFDTYQIDNYYARYLIVKAIKDLEPDAAMENFREANDIVYHQAKDELVRRHPYRVAYFYQAFFDKFGSTLTVSQLKEVGDAAHDIAEMATRLPEQRMKHPDIVRSTKALHYVIKKTNELITSLSND